MDNSVLILNGQVVRTDGLIEADGKLKLMTKLWENPDPTQSFADSVEINLSSDDYDFLLCNYTIDPSWSGKWTDSCIAAKGQNLVINKCSSGTNDFSRSLQYVNSKKYISTSGYTNTTINNNRCIPIVIYGIKKEYDIEALARNAMAKQIYSTDETVVGTWIDGKPVYRKVLVDAFTIPASQTNYAVGSAIVSNVDELIKSTLIAKRTNKWHCNSSYYYYESGGSADSCSLWLDPADHAIKPYAKNGIAAATTYTVIVEYTKTTD